MPLLSRVLLSALLVSSSAVASLQIVGPAGASASELLAAKEIRRYFYLRTGVLLNIAISDRRGATGAIVSANASRPVAEQALKTPLKPGEYVLRLDGRTLYAVGGDDAGTLYAAYRLAEILGVRFYLHGDVIPDARIAPELPAIDERGSPLFAVRGIQPFHDFPEGPDWWDRDDYLAYIAQLPKLRMNFFGLHTYPEGGVGPEPGVWIGREQDFDSHGRVSFSYPSRWANTARKDMWGYGSMKTSEFAAGTDLLFAADDYGPEVMSGVMPVPATTAQSNALFNAAGEMFSTVFAQARRLGIKTCIGTETPLTIPKLVRERMKAEGVDASDPVVARSVYAAMFRRIAALYPVDYYWLWTPEDWTWGGNKPEQFQGTARDIESALAALESVGKPFTLATSGWVLGPQNNRAALDKLLPKDSPVSCINRKVGHAPIDPMFANVTGREKWAIPWMENDPNLTAPQPWVGRMRYDAADARRLGCTGLLGIHWRTKILAPNVAALAAAAWDQSWVPGDFDSRPAPPGTGKADTAADGEGHDHPLRGRTMPVSEFYADFARANFGPEAGPKVGEIFTNIDGVRLPEPTTWLKGPGGIKVDTRPWADVRKQYAFVDSLERVRPSVRGAGNLQRFDYWLNTYGYMRAMAELACVRAELDKAVAQSPQGALPLRLRLARLWESMIGYQLAAADTPGEFGTLANLEQHNRKLLHFLDGHDGKIEEATGAPLPREVDPSRQYAGEPRIIVPTVRTLAGIAEAIKLKVIILDRQPPKSATLLWRNIGDTRFRSVPASHVSRAVYTASIPGSAADIEYYVRAESSSGKTLLWPPTAPSLNQTIVRW